VVAGAGLWVATAGQGRSARTQPESDPKPAASAPPPEQPEPPRQIDLNALRDLAVIRYDALQEMSGQLSFSLALLNSRGDGIVLSSINGRAETRTYAKVIVAGKSEQELSPEEVEAIRVARLGQGLGASAPSGGKGSHRREALQT
jgi:hypothetical protein